MDGCFLKSDFYKYSSNSGLGNLNIFFRSPGMVIVFITKKKNTGTQGKDGMTFFEIL